MASRKNTATHNQAVLWLDQEQLFLGIPSDEKGFSVTRVLWNPERLDIQSPEASSKLTAAFVGLAKQFSLQRKIVRLCLEDGLCVTRVVTGDRESVERELNAIRVRSQLYLSLGLGEKLTGSLRCKAENQSEYALTSIVNLRTMQTIYNAISTAKIRLESIEPVTLSVTRALGLLGIDEHEPALFVSVDNNRCDLAITRAGQLMLAYRISGVKQPNDIAIQIEANLTRLRRFCERVRNQGGSILNSIYIFGDAQNVEALGKSLRNSQAGIDIANVIVPESIGLRSDVETPPVVALALWAGSQWSEERTDCLPAPDLLAQLLQLQTKSMTERIISNFYPSAIAAGLMLVVLGLSINDQRHFNSSKLELASISEEVALAETKLAGWESKQRLIDGYEHLEQQLTETSWNQLLTNLAPCLPGNARLDHFSVNDKTSITLRGTMVARDQTYEMLSAIKQLSNVCDVSLESVVSTGDSTQNQFQFEVKFRLASIHSLAGITSESNSKKHDQIASN